MRLQSGRSYLPQMSSRYDAFVVTGQPGCEHLLAIVTDEMLRLDWLPNDPIKLHRLAAFPAPAN